MKKEGVELLPSSTINKLLVVVTLLALKNNDGSVQIMTRSVGSTTWKITACGTATGLAIYPGTKVYRFVKGLGGARQTAQLLISATTKAEQPLKQKKRKLSLDGQEIIGLEAIRQTCLN